jgi:16S rRNA (adenine1518-N6/adenine1519-N6)-dimethyltransferase
MAQPSIWRPKKRFGQHILRSRGILERILAETGLNERDTVIEIGAGLGDLTSCLASKAKRVIALELDKGLLDHLRERFSTEPKVQILNEDALRWPLPQAIEALERPRKVVGNLPYNVATRILLRFARFFQELDLMGFMFQKEVAERIVACPGTSSYGALTVLLALRWKSRIAFKLPPGAFFPRPKVESAFVVLEPKENQQMEIGDEDLFREIVQGAFARRRKTLANSLRTLPWATEEKLEELFSRSGIDPRRRAESLSLEEFARLSCEASNLRPL